MSEQQMTTLEKVKLSYHLASLLDNEDLKSNFMTLQGGEYALNVFKAAMEKEVERLITPSQVVEQVSEANKQIAEIVATIKQLQESLVDMVSKALSTQQGAVPGVRRGRPRDVPLPQEAQSISVEIPGDPEQDIQPIMF